MAPKKVVTKTRESLTQEQKYHATRHCDTHRDVFVGKTDAQVADKLSKELGFPIKGSHVQGIRYVLGISKPKGGAAEGVGYVTRGDFAILLASFTTLLGDYYAIKEENLENWMQKNHKALADLEDRILGDE